MSSSFPFLDAIPRQVKWGEVFLKHSPSFGYGLEAKVKRMPKKFSNQDKQYFNAMF